MLLSSIYNRTVKPYVSRSFGIIEGEQKAATIAAFSFLILLLCITYISYSPKLTTNFISVRRRTFTADCKGIILLKILLTLVNSNPGYWLTFSTFPRKEEMLFVSKILSKNKKASFLSKLLYQVHFIY